MSEQMYGIAILGFGVVGSGVAEVLDKNADRVSKNAGKELRLKYILDVRDFPDSPYADKMIRDFSVIENDPEVRVVAETIGGVGVAQEFTRRALAAGKSVVTSNKELVAKFGCELIKLAEEKGVNYLFEASVGGGIPILRPIIQCLAANRITEIYGILNGTTNYILTQMIKEKLPFDTALSQAQAAGYAEADPTSDIDGIDACRKISILADLTFGRNLEPDWIKTVGIRTVTAQDVKLAAMGGFKIKLLGRAVQDDDGLISAYVAPHLVPYDNMLAGVEGVMNGIIVRGNALGDAMFYGAGAGKLPTASAVVADIIDAAKHEKLRKLVSWDDGDYAMMRDSKELKSRWYVRLAANDENSASFTAEQKLGETDGYAGYILPKVSKVAIDAALAGLEVLTLFRILD